MSKRAVIGLQFEHLEPVWVLGGIGELPPGVFGGTEECAGPWRRVPGLQAGMLVSLRLTQSAPLRGKKTQICLNANEVKRRAFECSLFCSLLFFILLFFIIRC